MSPKDFPELKNYLGQEIITSDGTTLLGADDKAGVCAIVSACEYLLAHQVNQAWQDTFGVYT